MRRGRQGRGRRGLRHRSVALRSGAVGPMVPSRPGANPCRSAC